jgi:uncharacterized damage-inducible protein DinB
MRSIPLLAFATLLAAEPLSQGERDRAMSYLHATRKQFLDSVAGLSKAQWEYKPSAEVWSVAEVAEHIAISEDALFELVTKKIMAAPPADEAKRAAAKGKDEQVVKVITDRSQKAQAPEFLKPVRKWKTRDELRASFKKSRDRNIAYIQTTNDDLRAHVTPHPVMKEIDAYQWIMLIAAHSERHTMQLNEVKHSAGFPKR